MLGCFTFMLVFVFSCLLSCISLFCFVFNANSCVSLFNVKIVYSIYTIYSNASQSLTCLNSWQKIVSQFLMFITHLYACFLFAFLTCEGFMDTAVKSLKLRHVIITITHWEEVSIQSVLAARLLSAQTGNRHWLELNETLLWVFCIKKKPVWRHFRPIT